MPKLCQARVQQVVSQGHVTSDSTDVTSVSSSNNTHLSLVLFLLDLQSAELLNSKLPRWQETCGDATKVPKEVINMIEEIKTPVSTPISGTPQPSPMIERSNVVGTGYLFEISLVHLLM